MWPAGGWAAGAETARAAEGAQAEAGPPGNEEQSSRSSPRAGTPSGCRELGEESRVWPRCGKAPGPHSGSGAPPSAPQGVPWPPLGAARPARPEGSTSWASTGTRRALAPEQTRFHQRPVTRTPEFQSLGSEERLPVHPPQMSPGTNRCVVCLASPSPSGWACRPWGGGQPSGRSEDTPARPALCCSDRPTGRAFQKRSVCPRRRGVRTGVRGGRGGPGRGAGRAPQVSRSRVPEGLLPATPAPCAAAPGHWVRAVRGWRSGSRLQPPEHCVRLSSSRTPESCRKCAGLGAAAESEPKPPPALGPEDRAGL